MTPLCHSKHRSFGKQHDKFEARIKLQGPYLIREQLHVCQTYPGADTGRQVIQEITYYIILLPVIKIKLL